MDSEKRKKYRRERSKKNADKRREYTSTDGYKKLKIEQDRKYYEKNREKVIERKKNYYMKHKLDFRMRRAKYRTSKYSGDDKTINNTSIYCLYEIQGKLCNLCGTLLEGLTQKLSNGKEIDGKHLDHIIPISKGGTHSIFNVQRLCWKCNLKKHDHLDGILLSDK